MSRVPKSSAAQVERNTRGPARAQRVEPHDSLDDFPTPPWATRALLRILAQHCELKRQTVWEPACNRGFMVRPLVEQFGRVIATDVHDYRSEWPGQQGLLDFTLGWPDDYGDVDWVVTNPPFNVAEAFAAHARSRARIGYALFLRSAWLHGINRYRDIFAAHPPTLFCPFSERVNLFRGGVDPNGSSPTDFAWFVWIKDPALRAAMGMTAQCGLSRVAIIGPCRKDLDRDSDWEIPT